MQPMHSSPICPAKSLAGLKTDGFKYFKPKNPHNSILSLKMPKMKPINTFADQWPKDLIFNCPAKPINTFADQRAKGLSFDCPQKPISTFADQRPKDLIFTCPQNPINTFADQCAKDLSIDCPQEPIYTSGDQCAKDLSFDRPRNRISTFGDECSKDLSFEWPPKTQNLNPVQVSESVQSPKEKLGSKWREYAGSNDWNGLLDPLDANLRREIIKYGELVQATYTACEFDPSSSNYALCKHPKRSLLGHVGLQSSGYTVTRHVYATSAVGVPSWISSDATWLTRRTSWVGFVAVCEDEREIERLGRRDIVVAFRGTVTPLEWVENLRDVYSPRADVDEEARVQSGFWNLCTCEDPRGQSLWSDVAGEIERVLKKYEGEEVSVTIAGHSLGAALALVTGYQVGAAGFHCGNDRRVPVTVISFGGPRVGNRAFRSKIDEMGVKVLRVVNTQDVVTRVPGVLERVKGNGGYCHVGTELRLNNKDSPYLKPDADMACCHDLEAYLHLVDGFLSSSIPFRSSAKRDILRLLVNQKSNVLVAAAKSSCHRDRSNWS